MSYQNFKFLDSSNNNNIDNMYRVENFQNYNMDSNNYQSKEYFDNGIKQYEASNSDFFSMENKTPMNSDFSTNGRVMFDIMKPSPQYNLFEQQNTTHNDVESTLNYSQEATPLSNAYFSRTNMDIMQQLIKQAVYQKCQMDNDPILTNHKPIHIANQDETNLKVIMRSIYLQYAKNAPTDIDGQIKQLNNLVLNECVPDIITNLKQYLGYVADIQRLPNPLDHPSYISSKGEKTYSLLIV